MNCYRIYSFFIHKLSNAAKVINKGHLRGFSLPNVHYADFNKEQGKWSTLSVYELVSDPWLPATYVGIYLLIIGAILMFVTAGRNKYKKEEGKK